MKKYILATVIVFCLVGLLPLAAASYDNNEFQRKSRAYSEMAVTAYDEGDYDGAVEYAKQAESNALLSAAFIEKAIARADTETVLFKAHTRLTWAKDKKAEKYFPSEFETATVSVASADGLFAQEEYSGAKQYAELALESLSVIREIIPLPATYRVELWTKTRDCLWNIAKNPAVYGNPLAWEKLYEANKKYLKQPANPNLLKPGMIVKIPSIQGEYREGAYNPSIKYEPFKAAKKK